MLGSKDLWKSTKPKTVGANKIFQWNVNIIREINDYSQNLR